MKTDRTQPHLLIYKMILAVAAICFIHGNSAIAQSSCEGDCQNGYGKLSMPNLMVISKFSEGYNEGASLQYWKDGNVRIAYYQDRKEIMTVWLNPQNSTLFMGYQTQNAGEPIQFHDGLSVDLTTFSLSKISNQVKSPLTIDATKFQCLLGDCRNGFGADYFSSEKGTGLIRINDNFENFKLNGVGVIYGFPENYYEIGSYKGKDLSEGAKIFVVNDGISMTFLANGIETKKFLVLNSELWPETVVSEAQALNYSNKNTSNLSASAPKKKRRGFLQGLCDVLLAVLQVGAEVVVQSYEADQKANKEREAREATAQQQRQNQPRQVAQTQNVAQPTAPPNAKCNYAFDLSVRQNVRSRVSGPEIVDVAVAISNVYTTNASEGKHSLDIFATQYVYKKQEDAEDIGDGFLDEYSETKTKNNTTYIYTVTRIQKANTCK